MDNYESKAQLPVVSASLSQFTPNHDSSALCKAITSHTGERMEQTEGVWYNLIMYVEGRHR